MKKRSLTTPDTQLRRRLLAATIGVCMSLVAASGIATAQDSAGPTTDALIRQTLEEFHTSRLEAGLETLGLAIDSVTATKGEDAVRFAVVGAALNRRLQQVDSYERFDRLYKWSMPDASRSAVRHFITLIPQTAPPGEFARAVGERPRRNSFPVSSTGGLPGVFSSGWLLAESAKEAGQLRRLTDELIGLSKQGVANADELLRLVWLTGGKDDAELQAWLKRRVAEVRREQPVRMPGRGMVPGNVIWQFGYAATAADVKSLNFRPLPFWSGNAWQGSGRFPDDKLGWLKMDATGGHTDQHFQAIRRWVSPVDGLLTISGQLSHQYTQGDGVRGRVVIRRSEIAGEWTIHHGSVSTSATRIPVRAWDTVDFVVDIIDDPSWDHFSWPVKLLLATRRNEIRSYDSLTASLTPSDSGLLNDLMTAAACSKVDVLRPHAAELLTALQEQTAQSISAPLRSLVARAHSQGVAALNGVTSETLLASTTFPHWVAATSDLDGSTNVEGASPIWLAQEGHVLRVAGSSRDTLFFRYPITGEFEFMCDAQLGGQSPTDGGLTFGGMVFTPQSAGRLVAIRDTAQLKIETRSCPFIRVSTEPVFHRLSIRSDGAEIVFSVNGHPVWKEASPAGSSPWLGLQANGDHRPLFRNLTLTGSVNVPRQVELLSKSGMRGWQSWSPGWPTTPPARTARVSSPIAEAAAVPSGRSQSRWSVTDGVLNSPSGDPGSGEQNVLSCHRPMQPGESVSCEFMYQPGVFEVHPVLGRLAFLLDSNGIRVRWLSDANGGWTSLEADNSIIEPLNRRASLATVLRPGEWNTLKLTLVQSRVELSLNGELVYRRELEPGSSSEFGLLHDRTQHPVAVSVRNIVLKGDWPETLSPEILSELLLPDSGELETSTSQTINSLMGESSLQLNEMTVIQRARQLDLQTRFEYLREWVLPSATHNSIRVGGLLTTTHLAPAENDWLPEDSLQTEQAERSGERRVQSGGRLLSATYELVATAASLNRLTELQDQVRKLKPKGVSQQRAQTALLALMALTVGDLQAAADACEELLTLPAVVPGQPSSLPWPEMLILYRGLPDPTTRSIVAEIASRLLTRILEGKSTGDSALDHHLAALHGLYGAQSGSTVSGERGTDRSLARWFPASLYTALTRGAGMPQSEWVAGTQYVEKLAPHDRDLLFYQLPLTGDFEVECEVACGAPHNTGLMFAGVHHAFLVPSAVERGDLWTIGEQTVDPPFSHYDVWARMRMSVRDGLCTTWYNGLKIDQRQLSAHHIPWLAIHSRGRQYSAVRNICISGKPIVPEQVLLSAEPGLPGWYGYYGEQPGSPDTPGAWTHLDHTPGGGIVGTHQPQVAGSFKESLLCYHRPLLENGVVEYGFYYVPGEVIAHPALDRLAFLLEPDGVRLHWITDREHDRFHHDPANSLVDEAARRGPERLPLVSDNWNRMRLALKGDTVQLVLNDELIYEHRLSVTNQRTLGLFHYSDQAELRVRNVSLRGEWPRVVPEPDKQELIDQQVITLDNSRDALPASFSHSFVQAGLPTELPDSYFKSSSSTLGRITSGSAGLSASITSAATWTHASFSPQFSLKGDFDIEVAFENMLPTENGQAGLLLTVELGDVQRSLLRAMRMNEENGRQRVHASQSILQKDGSRSYQASQTVSCEAFSGRLRLARRGTKIYYLFAENDSSVFRLVDTVDSSDADTVPDGLMIRTMSFQRGQTSVTWKDISLRAERMTWYPPPDANRQWKLLVMDEDGSNLRSVADRPQGNRSLGSPEWSTDGKQISFDTYQASLSDSHCRVVNVDDLKVFDCGLGCMPGLSPDGKRIVFTQSGRGILMMNADGTNREEVDRNGWSAQWSPDGKSLAWGQSGNIIIMDLETKERTPLLTGEQAAMFSYTYWNPGWSHDSRFVAFKARNRRTGGEDIVVAEVGSPGSFQVLLESSKGVHPDFTFSPDNRRVLFAMNDPAENKPRLYTVDRTKPGPPQQLPGQPLDWKIFGGDWHPNGKIAFAGEQIAQPVDWVSKPQ
ncbi:MAG: DUF1583 domain-containing protein [Rhodopirellula sp.]|nr:DUF1583 domain-containing protein [Rhodopirellula sp.]